MIRDRIVFGVKDPDLKDKLLTVNNLTMNMAEETCKTTKATKKELQVMTSTSEVNMVKMNNIKGITAKNNSNKKNNKWIKKSNDRKLEKNYERHNKNVRKSMIVRNVVESTSEKSVLPLGKCVKYVKKMNHFALGCKLRDNKEVKEVHKTHNIVDSDEEIFQINAIGSKSSQNKKVMVENKNIIFKLDSGSDVNIIPWKFFKEIKPEPQLE